MKAPPPPRLFPFLAREAPIGVILRRGPVDWAHLTVWRTDRDIFVHGQWMRGRVYEDRGDLAPDGSLFLYFTRKQNPHTVAGGYGDAWTAISKPPYFTALALWLQGGTYFGGGLFEDNHTVLLNGLSGANYHPNHKPEGLIFRGARGRLVDGWAYTERLQRDGWQVHGQWATAKVDGWSSVAKPPSTWSRLNPPGTHMLVMTYPGSSANPAYKGIMDYDPDLPGGFGGYAVRFSVQNVADGSLEKLDGASWADWDQQGRLVLVKQGRLFSWQPPASGQGTLRELADFTTLRPEPSPSPAWAHTWSKRKLRVLRSGLRYV